MIDLVVVPCAAKKRSGGRYLAYLLYQGPFFRLAYQAALHTNARHLRILSGKHGLLHPYALIESYEQRIDRPGAVTLDTLRQQVVDQGLSEVRSVLCLCPSAYARIVRQLWPEAECPLLGIGGIGCQMAWLRRRIDGSGIDASA